MSLTMLMEEKYKHIIEPTNCLGLKYQMDL